MENLQKKHAEIVETSKRMIEASKETKKNLEAHQEKIKAFLNNR